jgi:uncharacterized protein YwgA
MTQVDRFTIIRYLVDNLKDVGKIRMQKLTYFLQYIFGVPLGYVYKMHYYGPYSDELNEDLILMQVSRNVEIETDPSGYGYHIIPGPEAVTTKGDILGTYSEQVSKCLNEFVKFDTNQLEILSTLHFVKYVAGVSDESRVIEKTVMLKPKFQKSVIEETYRQLESITNSAS